MPTAATGSDLEVMVSEKLTDMCHDPKCVQVIVAVTEQGEKLLLRDMGGIFLIILPASNVTGFDKTRLPCTKLCKKIW